MTPRGRFESALRALAYAKANAEQAEKHKRYALEQMGRSIMLERRSPSKARRCCVSPPRPLNDKGGAMRKSHWRAATTSTTIHRNGRPANSASKVGMQARRRGGADQRLMQSALARQLGTPMTPERVRPGTQQSVGKETQREPQASVFLMNPR